MQGLSEETIERLFTYQAPRNDAEIAAHKELRHAAKMYALAVKRNTPESAVQTLAIRKIQEADMMAHCAIATNTAAVAAPPAEQAAPEPEPAAAEVAPDNA